MGLDLYTHLEKAISKLDEGSSETETIRNELRDILVKCLDMPNLNRPRRSEFINIVSPLLFGVDLLVQEELLPEDLEYLNSIISPARERILALAKDENDLGIAAGKIVREVEENGGTVLY